ncbi:MAG: maleylpyruvate isomerase family mycothiol-dependent enzyme [Ilumatobacter sp.]|uniref:maleylpyruvate isomerase family mycothiol-dependent enzyme n=1 Tax=Ilumatobacter sp. TaxID=1967498 RepID=UPI003C742C56
MDLPFDPLGVLQTNGIAFIDLVRSNEHDTPIPSCPDWNLGDLADHMADGWTFWSRVVADGITDRGELQTIEVPTGLTGDLLIDWLGASHNALYSALADAAPDQPAWSWAGSKLDVSWVRRRMVHESAVHLWDLANAVDDPYEIPTNIAADGIDEFLMHFMGHRRGEGEMKVGGTVHLHCTDTTEADTAGGEWYISAVKEPSCTFTREHRKGDAAIRGRAHDLQLWLWRRNGFRPDEVEVIGNDVVARRFRAYSDLGF